VAPSIINGNLKMCSSFDEKGLRLATYDGRDKIIHDHGQHQKINWNGAERPHGNFFPKSFLGN
jgi:hypothetical protein